AQFHRVGLCRRAIFFRPERHPVKGLIGSWESHRRVAIDALARGARRVLVCEDDVAFRRTSPRTVAAIGRALGLVLEPFLVILERREADAEPLAEPAAVAVDLPNPHLGYALTW
ncbi:MAG: hypothetical protein N2038_14340, partial [Geminicoccaceae bacterium]|nr:hypothetical protein [Geminicoccaceae bacterium]